MDSNESKKSKILEFAEAHPYVLLAAIAVLVIVVLVMIFGKKVAPSISSLCGKKKKEPLNEDDEVDELIESIHNKQKKRKQ